MAFKRRASPGSAAVRELTLPAGWRQVNGWSLLHRLTGKHPFLMPFTAVIGPVAIAGGATNETETNATGTVSLPEDAEYYFLETTVSGYPTADPSAALLGPVLANDPEGWNAYVKLELDSGGPMLSSQRVRVGHIFGNAQRPYRWPVPWIVHGGGSISLALSQRDNTAHTAYFAFHGFKRFLSEPALKADFYLTPRVLEVLRRERELKAGFGVRLEPFVAGLAFEPTLGRAPAQMESRAFGISDGDFVILDCMGTVEDPGNGDIFTIPDAAVRLNVNQAVRMDDRSIPFSSAFGVARRPRKLLFPLVLRQGQTLTALYQSNTIAASTSGATNCQLAFVGCRMTRGGR